jgi:hypothetical protein
MGLLARVPSLKLQAESYEWAPAGSPGNVTYVPGPPTHTESPSFLLAEPQREMPSVRAEPLRQDGGARELIRQET